MQKTNYAICFLLEDVKELAKRNKCAEHPGDEKYNTESTDREQMTKVAIFEYMIGNTDWSVPANHNIKIIHFSVDSTTRPYPVPYDFDFSGIVNTRYATPDEKLAITDVRTRVYRGYTRSEAELNKELQIFNKQKDKMYALINNCDMLLAANKKTMINYFG